MTTPGDTRGASRGSADHPHAGGAPRGSTGGFAIITPREASVLAALADAAAGRATHVVAAALFASYPLSLWLGWRHGRR